MIFLNSVSPLAHKYAQAFLNVFPQAISLSNLDKIEKAYYFLRTQRRTLFFLQLSHFSVDTKASMVKDLIGYCELPDQLADLFLLLIRHNRYFLIPDVLYYIVQLYKKNADIVDFSVISVGDLTEEKRASIKQFLVRMTGKNVMCAYQVDDALIAGIQLKSIDYRWEYSVRKQIEGLRAR